MRAGIRLPLKPLLSAALLLRVSQATCRVWQLLVMPSHAPNACAGDTALIRGDVQPATPLAELNGQLANLTLSRPLCTEPSSHNANSSPAAIKARDTHASCTTAAAVKCGPVHKRCVIKLSRLPAEDGVSHRIASVSEEGKLVVWEVMA